LEAQVDPHKIISLVTTYAVPALIALIILWVGFGAARVVASKAEGGFNKAPNSDPGLSRFFASLVKFLLMLVVVMAALSVIGVDTSPIFGLIAASGAALAFVLQGALGNVAAGVMLVLFKPYKIGDDVEVGGESGKVSAIELTATRLTTTDNVDIIIANGKIWGGTIKNYTSMGARRLDRDFGISYDDDIDKAIAAITSAAAANPRVHADPAPWAKVVNLGDSSVDIQLRAWCDAADYKALSTEISQPVKQALDAAGISIPYPHEVKIKQTVKSSKGRDRSKRLKALKQKNA
jgi:small conductance mechanosensitive channel